MSVLLWLGAIACIGLTAWASKKDWDVQVLMFGALGLYVVCKAVEIGL